MTEGQPASRGVLCLWGPVRVELAGETIEPGGPREGTVLAALALSAGRPVSVERLTDWLWSQDPPASSRKSIQNAVLRLRRRLAGVGASLEHVGDAYLLRLGPLTLDTDDLSSASTGGQPLERTVPSPAQQIACTRLSEARAAALETRLAARLELDPAAAAADLEAAVTDQPTREPLWALLMQAHYRCGRTAEALRTFQRARQALAQELGVEPGPLLREVHVAVLNQDPRILADQRALGLAQLADAAACAELGDVAGARSRYREAATSARRAGDLALLADAIVGLAGDAQWMFGDTEIEGLLEQMLTRLTEPPADRIRAGRVAAGLALLRSIRGDVRTRVHAAQALELTAESAPASVRTSALFAAATGWEGPDDSNARAQAGRALLEHGLASQDPTAQALGHQYLAWASLERGDGNQAATERALMLEAARDQPSPHLAAQVADTEFLEATLAGRFTDARSQLDSLTAAWQHAADPGFAFVCEVGARLMLGELTDDLDPLLPMLEMGRAAIPGDNMWTLCIALTHALAGRQDAAAGACSSVSVSDLRALPRAALWIANITGTTMIAALTGNRVWAAVMLEQLAPLTGTHVVVAGLAYRGSVAHWQGLALHTIGDLSAAEQALRRALADHQHVASEPWIAQSEAALARLLRQQPNGATRREADELAERSALTASKLGMVLLSDRCSQ